MSLVAMTLSSDATKRMVESGIRHMGIASYFTHHVLEIRQNPPSNDDHLLETYMFPHMRDGQLTLEMIREVCGASSANFAKVRDAFHEKFPPRSCDEIIDTRSSSHAYCDHGICMCGDNDDLISKDEVSYLEIPPWSLKYKSQ